MRLAGFKGSRTQRSATHAASISVFGDSQRLHWRSSKTSFLNEYKQKSSKKIHLKKTQIPLFLQKTAVFAKNHARHPIFWPFLRKGDQKPSLKTNEMGKLPDQVRSQIEWYPRFPFVKTSESLNFHFAKSTRLPNPC